MEVGIAGLSYAFTRATKAYVATTSSVPAGLLGDTSSLVHTIHAAVLTDSRVHNHITTCRLQAAIQCPVAQPFAFPISLALIWGAVFRSLQLTAACFFPLPRFVYDIYDYPRYIY
jgi:hypothetical protein